MNDRLEPRLWDREYWHLRAIRDFLVRALEHNGGGRVLDFGAGASPYRLLFDKMRIESVAADICPSHPGVLPIDDAGRVPVPDGFFDIVLSTQVLEHVPDVNRYLQEAHRVLRPGGMLLLTTHGSFMLHRHPVDYRRWTTDGLRYELEQADFCVEAVESRVGILANATHQRALMYGGLLKCTPFTRWLRPILFFCFNIRMACEEWLTPSAAMEILPSMLLAKGRKRTRLEEVADNKSCCQAGASRGVGSEHVAGSS